MTYLCTKCGDEFYHDNAMGNQECPTCESEPETHIAQPFSVLGDYLRFYDEEN